MPGDLYSATGSLFVIIWAMDDKKVLFYPFHAINKFMLLEYRREVLQQVLSDTSKLSGGQRGALNGDIKRLVKVPGFRNSSIAPLPLKIRGAESTFEHNSGFTARVLEGWSEIHGDLKQQVYDLLKSRNWEILPVEADRTKLPGFLGDWPKEETYEVLNKTFSETYAGSPASEYDVRLMIVWLSGRLPVNMADQEAS
jgi:hypothetical protein